jgi:hypothetical protein
MLTKTQKDKLIKVCKVLFPKYKFVTIDLLVNKVTFRNCDTAIIKWFFPKWRISLDELMNYRIPQQMADFMYNNKSFISKVHDELVKCDLAGTDRIDYFYEEIAKVKYADLYKELKLEPKTVKFPSNPDEDEIYEAVVLMQKYEERERYPTLLSRWLHQHFNIEGAFYTCLLLIVIVFTLTKIHL